MATFVCTRDDRLMRLEGGRSLSAEPALEGAGAQCVAASGERVVVGTRGGGLLVSEDAGGSWERIDLPEPDVLSVAIGPADGALYAGTEPSRVFVSRDGGQWSELEALQDIPSRDQWSFPPRPWTHHVRWIAPDPHRAERLLVGIELGGLMYTDDGGASFTDHRPGAKRDAHNIAWHPTADGRAYQAAGDGAAWSHDGGQTWEAVDSGRDLRYCWALAVDPEDPECWYVSAASGPGAAHSGEDARGGLYRWERDGWQRLELPGDSMPYALAVTDGDVISGMADGRILRSGNRGASWEETGVRVGSITAMAADS
ncbi:MAG: WD40/YVTN/BNR-like repeat-containing protein [Solirubrobacterales bacterium]